MHTHKSYPSLTSTNPHYTALRSAWLAYFHTPDNVTNQNALLLSLDSIIRRAAENQARRYRLANDIDDIAQEIRTRIAKKHFLLRNPGLQEWTTRSEPEMTDVDDLGTELLGAINRLASWCALDRIDCHRQNHLSLDAKGWEAMPDEVLSLPPPSAAQDDLHSVLVTFRRAAAEDGFGLAQTEALVAHLLGASTQQTLAAQLGCSQSQASKTLRRLTRTTALRCGRNGSADGHRERPTVSRHPHWT